MVGKPAATVITSSPGRSRSSPRAWLVNAVMASRLADDPEFTINACRIPTLLASALSNSFVSIPDVSQKSKEAFTAASISSSPKTFPVTGIGDSPGTNGGVGCRSLNSSPTNFRIRSRLLELKLMCLQSNTFKGLGSKIQ